MAEQSEAESFRFESLNAVTQQNRVHEFRREIALVADRAFQMKHISRDALEGLKAMSLGTVAFPMTDEKLKKALKFQRDDYAQAESLVASLQSQLNQAIRQGIASTGDRDFLKDRLILTGEHNLTEKAQTLKEKVQGKIDRMRSVRDAYDKIAHHPLARNTGFLRVDAQTKVSVPDEKAFLALKVPERRALVEKLRDAIVKAERYAKEAGNAGPQNLMPQYEMLLKKAQHETKIIGKKTADKFRDGFRACTPQDRKEWLGEFGSQMKRYQDLWAKIRGTLKGERLARIESKRDNMGYRETESEFICLDYESRLEKLRDRRVISRHTQREFTKDIRRQSLPEQRRYLASLPAQMERYESLRVQIDEMKSKKAQGELNAMYEKEDCGYTQIYQRYLALEEGRSHIREEAFQTEMDSLSHVRRERVRKNIIWGKNLLKTQDQKERMLSRLDRMIEREEETRYDATNYTQSVKKVRTDQQKKEETENPSAPSLFKRWFGRKKGQPAVSESASDESESMASLRSENRRAEQTSDAHVHVITKANDAFSMARVSGKQEEKKVIRFGIADEEAVQAFLQEDVNLERDSVHLMAKEGTIDRMTFTEIRAYRDYVREQLRAA